MIALDNYQYNLSYEHKVVLVFCKNSIKKAVLKNSFNFL